MSLLILILLAVVP